MSTSESSKRPKLESSPEHAQNPDDPDDDDNDADDLEQDHCTICLQPFIDRTIIPVCAHEFCFECILLWSEQSRKCPLCSGSFHDAYLIHHVRSQHDYQKHYLLPLRSSSLPPPLAASSHAHALRHARRARQWGRRQRHAREEADQLERAIARRRWIYQHHLYAKHVASNPYTRYRPFPTPAQFSASQDLISRMTMFLRRELRVWPNLDVEFLTTYTISLMKSIDVRSEPAVKLLSEFLDLDTPYGTGARQVNAEHFAHEIYSYLRSPYRDLTMYDQVAQYDVPPEISPPEDMERGSRWDTERPASRRSRAQSPDQSSHRENNSTYSPTARHGRDESADTRREDRPNSTPHPSRSPKIRDDYESDFRNRSADRKHSLSDGVQDTLRNDPPGRMFYPASSSSSAVVLPETPNDAVPVRVATTRDKDWEEDVVAAPTISGPNATAAQGAVRRLVLAQGDTIADYVDNVSAGSAANPRSSRKRSAAMLRVGVHPRHRSLSESVQAYLDVGARAKAAVVRTTATTTTATMRRVDDREGAVPKLLLRLKDGPTGPGAVGVFSSVSAGGVGDDDGGA